METYRFRLKGQKDIFSRTFELPDMRASKIAEYITKTMPGLKGVSIEKIRLEIDNDILSDNSALNEIVNPGEIIDIVF